MTDLSETDRIERDLARTRARMDGRLDELQAHLTPRQLANDAFAYVRGGDGADFAQDLVSRIRANPLPVALAGIGIAWLMASASDTSPRPAPKPTSAHDRLQARLRSADAGVQRAADDDEDSYGARLDDARGAVLGVARTAADDATSYRRRIGEAIASAAQSARETRHDAKAGADVAFGRIKDAAGDRAAAMQQGVPDMTRSARDTLSSVAGNPFALGAIAAVVGAVAGALIPTLDEEEAALGSVATKVRTAGRDLAQDVVDRGGRIANETLGAVKDSVASHGLTADTPVGALIGDARSGSLAENVRQVAQETLQAGRDSARTHLSSDPAAAGQDG